MLQKGSKKLINSWAFYDWANSVYSLVIATAVFPIYYDTITAVNGDVPFLGTEFNPISLYDYALSFSFFIVVILSPILSGIADYTGNKLKFLKFFCLLGSLSVMSLFFFTGVETLWVGILFTILASVGFWGSIVFYNAYLPEVAYPEQQDKASAKGFIYGYVGSVILLLINLIMIMYPGWFGFTDSTLPSRISFVMVGVWWLGFAQITFARLPNNVYNKRPEKDYIFKGFKELQSVANQLIHYPQLKMFLIAFFLLSVGVQTIVLMAGIFGSKELGLRTDKLIITILLVQIVAIVGAFVFSRISSRIGNLKTLKITVSIWVIVCFTAFLLDKEQRHIELYFYILGGLIGLVLGAIQSMARSTYSKLLPETTDHATYFSFYDVTEKIAIILGTFVFGLLIALTDSMQWSVLFLGVFFIASFVVLSLIKKTQYVR